MIEASSAVRRYLADPDRPGSIADRARTQRGNRLRTAFPDLERLSVLDLGGTAGYWQHLGIRPAHLTLVNLHDTGTPGVRMIIGNACKPPREALDRRYDLVLSNSVIDQVGGLEQREQLAHVIRSAGDAYWVQTANRAFPIDAYFLFPYFSYLPERLQVRIVRHWRVTHMHTRDPLLARERVRSMTLQSKADLRALFPGSRIMVERFAGLPKSLIAVRD